MGAKMMLGERIRELRGNMSAVEFCRQFGIHRNTLPRYESSERTPDAEFIVAICEYYGINPSWLLMGEGEKHAEPRHREAATDMAKDILLGDKEVAKRRQCRIKETGGLMRAAKEAVGQAWQELGGNAIPEPQTDAEKRLSSALFGLLARYEAAEFGRLSAEGQADSFKESQRHPGGEAVATEVDLSRGVELLARIYGSGNQVLIRAIIANLLAFVEAIENHRQAEDYAQNNKELRNQVASLQATMTGQGAKLEALEAKLNSLEEQASPKQAVG